MITLALCVVVSPGSARIPKVSDGAMILRWTNQRATHPCAQRIEKTKGAYMQASKCKSAYQCVE
jgi:hypothetical protein